MLSLLTIELLLKVQKRKKKKKGGRGKKKDKRDLKAKRDARRKGESEALCVNGDETGKVTDSKLDSDGVQHDEPNKCGDGSENVSVDENGTKKVVIKRLDPDQPSPEIEIKVLIPGPNESVFPSDINEKDHRDVEPMDVDSSMIQNPEDSLIRSPTESSRSPPEYLNDDKESYNECELSEPKSLSSPFKQPSAAISILSSAKDFASSVIEKLKTPSQQLSSELSTSPSCVTPPPTPVNQYLDDFMKSRSDSNVKSSSVDGADALSKQDGENSTDVSKLQEQVLISNSTSLPSSSVDNETVPKQSNEILVCGGGITSAQATSESPVVSENSSTPISESQSLNESSQKEESDIAKTTSGKVKKERDPTKPTFRVTCNRVGDNHSFDSSSAAASLGSAVITYFKWSVDLKNFDIEVLLNIDNEEVTVALGITKTSLHNRNLVAFGPTTLRATICYNMLRLCRIRNGDFVCDPMCGTSAIPVEGCLQWPNSFHFGGDYHEKGIERSLENIAAVREKSLEEKRDSLKVGTVQWNVEHFPLRDKCVDVFVSDLPFGYRMGSRTTNRTLYPTLLDAMARAARTGARACLLTEDKTSLIKALQTMGRLWQRRVILSINMGGLSGFVFLLTRTTASYSAPQESWKQETSDNSDNLPSNNTEKQEVTDVQESGEGVCRDEQSCEVESVTDKNDVVQDDCTTVESQNANI